LKILHTYSAYKPSFETGGVARSCYEITKGLAKMGHEVTVYTTDRGENRVDTKKNSPVEVDGVQVYYFKNISNHLAMRSKIITPYYAPLVARKKIENFDIIHIHGYRNFLSAIVAYYARKYDVSYVVQPRGSAQKMAKSLPKTTFDLLFGYKILRRAARILLSSKNEYSLSKPILEMVENNEDGFSYMPNGINIDDFYDSEAHEKNFRRSYNVDQDQKIILYLGRISERKGIDLLIKSLRGLIEKRRKLKLIITGPRNDYELKLKNNVKKLKLEKHTIFTGPLYNSDKIEAYNAADVFVLPSKDKQESFGNVVLEASACGTPCVATDVCGVTEWMDNLIKVDSNEKSIVKGIEKALSKEELGKKAREEVYEKFKWKSIIENELIPIYEEIIKPREN